MIIDADDRVLNKLASKPFDTKSKKKVDSIRGSYQSLNGSTLATELIQSTSRTSDINSEANIDVEYGIYLSKFTSYFLETDANRKLNNLQLNSLLNSQTALTTELDRISPSPSLNFNNDFWKINSKYLINFLPK